MEQASKTEDAAHALIEALDMVALLNGRCSPKALCHLNTGTDPCCPRSAIGVIHTESLVRDYSRAWGMKTLGVGTTCAG